MQWTMKGSVEGSEWDAEGERPPDCHSGRGFRTGDKKLKTIKKAKIFF